MNWLNYHHLFYFWTVVREGGVSAAAKRLHLAQPTISGQLKELEEAMGERLFERQNGKKVLTEVGQVVYRYADEIFTLGRELQDALRGRPTGRPLRIAVGIAEVVPKLIAHRLLEPALQLAEPVQLLCFEDRTEQLLAQLSAHTLDLVISDSPVGPSSSVRAYSHLLGECGVTLFAMPPLAGSLRRGFPRSLEQATLLLPPESTLLRRSLSRWLENQGVRPKMIHEFQDSALMKAFGQAGVGAFPAPSAIVSEVKAQYGAEVVGHIDSIRERFYAITVERKLKHPATVAISEAARHEFFSQR